MSFFLEIQLSKEVNPTNTNPVMGVAWLEENIYVVYRSSNIVYVHPDQESSIIVMSCKVRVVAAATDLL